MAVVLYKSADRTVNNIAERNSIQHKIDHMVVTVLDSIADIDAGAGVATYRFNKTLDSWILISKSNSNTINFETEEQLITNGSVTASNIPTSNQIWDVKVVDGDVIVAEVRTEDLIVSSGNISGLNVYNGKKLRFTYAYGTISQQVSEYIDSRLQGVSDDNGSISDFEGALA